MGQRIQHTPKGPAGAAWILQEVQGREGRGSLNRIRNSKPIFRVASLLLSHHTLTVYHTMEGGTKTKSWGHHPPPDPQIQLFFAVLLLNFPAIFNSTTDSRSTFGPNNMCVSFPTDVLTDTQS